MPNHFPFSDLPKKISTPTNPTPKNPPTQIFSPRTLLCQICPITHSILLTLPSKPTHTYTNKNPEQPQPLQAIAINKIHKTLSNHNHRKPPPQTKSTKPIHPWNPKPQISFSSRIKLSKPTPSQRRSTYGSLSFSLNDGSSKKSNPPRMVCSWSQIWWEVKKEVKWERENNIKLDVFGLLMNSSLTEGARYYKKVKKFIRNDEADAGGFGGQVYSQFFCEYTVWLFWWECS